MSETITVIIEPDFQYLKKLTRELSEFGVTVFPKTEIEDISQLLEIKGKVGTVILNLELKNDEGLTVYANLRKHSKFKDSKFIFLADDKNLYNLVKNMDLDNAVILDKSTSFEIIIEETLNNLQMNSTIQNGVGHHLILDGDLKEFPIEQLLAFCKDNYVTGQLNLNIAGEKAHIAFWGGQIQKVYYKELPKELALAELKLVQNGSVQLKQLLFNSEDFHNYLYKNNVNSIFSVKDILVDLFYFLFNFFSEKVGENSIDLIFKQKFEEYASNFSWFAGIQYVPDVQEKVSVSFEPSEEQIEVIVLLYKEILSEIILQNDQLSLEEFYIKLSEIKPYLEQFNLWKKLTRTELLSEF